MNHFITTVSLVLFASYGFTIEADSTYDPKWWDTLNCAYTVKLETSYEVHGLSEVTNDDFLSYWKTDTSSIATNDISVRNDTLHITHSRQKAGQNSAAVVFQSVRWIANIPEKFGAGADTLYGMYVNMVDDIIVSATIESDKACEIYMELTDCNGHIANSQRLYNSIDSGVAHYTFDFEERLYDWYNGYFWGVSNGRDSATELILNNYVFTYTDEEYIPFDGSKVAQVRWIINPGTESLIGDTVTVKLSNVIIGAKDDYVPFLQEEEWIFNQENLTPNAWGCYFQNVQIGIIPFADSHYSVYTISGIKIKDKIVPDELPFFPAGIYIISNGKETEIISVN